MRLVLTTICLLTSTFASTVFATQASQTMLALSVSISKSFAHATSIVADCNAPATPVQNPLRLQIYKISGGYRVKLNGDRFPVQEFELVPGQKLTVIFANVLVAEIKNGVSSDSVLGSPGTEPQPMNCTANL